MTLLTTTDRSAVISECGLYRYRLERQTGASSGTIAWLMLNPSTADATADDPTIRKVLGFSEQAHYRWVIVVNLFAWRATDPRDCRANLAQAEGAQNRDYILQAADDAQQLVCAWGAQPWATAQACRVLRWFGGYRKQSLLRIGGELPKNGAPRHPLMAPYASGLVPFEADAFCARHARALGWSR